MKKQKRSNSSGITLIALVISIIVMLILAGISINAIVGENGVLTKAQKATIESKKASILEELNMKLAEYNINTLTDKDTGTKQILTELITGKYIEGVLCSDGTYKTDSAEVLPVPRFDEGNNFTGEFAYGVTKEDYKINIYTANDGIYKAEYGEISFSSGGGVQEGTVLVTKDSFNSSEDVEEKDKGKFTVDGNSDIIFIDKIEGELSFYIKSGAHAKVNIFNDMTLTNTGMSRSAIDIEPNGILDLYVAEGVTLDVNSGFAEEGEKATGWNAKGGAGGYAGIHVPSIDGVNATLNLLGDGTIIARGGDASDGNGTYGIGDSNTGGGGGGGAGAGIGGNGGQGGSANGEISNKINGSGHDGEKGEDCGNVNIHNAIKVYAYGGGGGAAIPGTNENAGTGGGGYPAAGIGGGGAGGGGGDHAAGAGGYCGGTGQPLFARADNGLTAAVSPNHGTGGAYFEKGNISTVAVENQETFAYIGGQGAKANSWNSQGGDGGVAGKGGTIKVSKNAEVYAYNGNKYTDDTAYNDGENQLEIYSQNGILRAIYKYAIFWNNKEYRYVSYFKELFGIDVHENIDTYVASPETSNTYLNYLVRDEIRESESRKIKTSYINNRTGNCYGVGSGAGYIELSNGTYIIDSTLN